MSAPSPALIAKDEKMSAANTIKRFLLSLNQSFSEKKIIEQIFTNKQFLSQVFMGEEQRMEINLEINDEYKSVNRLLKELSIQIHIETGASLYFYTVSPFMGSGWVVRKEKPANRKVAGLIEDEPPEIKDIDLDKFVEIIMDATKKIYYVSLFENKIKNIAFFSHNRDVILKTVEEFVENFIFFGHTKSGLNLFILDDSDDSERKVRKNKIIDFASSRCKEAGITVFYLGEEEKNNKINDYEKTISNIPQLKLEKGKIIRLINSALGLKGGPGANRNWAFLHNCIQIDDDVHPYTKVKIDGVEKNIPIDILTGINRSLLKEESNGVNYEYCGARDGPGIRKLALYFSVDKEPYPLSYHLDYLSMVNEDKPLFTLYSYFDPRNYPPHGGVFAVLPMNNDVPIVPSSPTCENYLRVEDFIFPAIVERIILIRSNNKSKGKFYHPGGAVFHEPKFGQAPINIAKSVINEIIGFIFIYIVINVFKKEVISKNDLTELEKNYTGLLERLGEALNQIIVNDQIEFYVKSWIENTESPDFALESDFKGFSKKINLFFSLYDKHNHLLNETNHPKKAAVESIKTVLKELNWLTSFEEWKSNNCSIDWKKLDFSKVNDILKKEIKTYADTLIIWPYLLIAAGLNNKNAF
ncbi:MAG: hypothetical protein HY094_00150 [Candidatus Melainabacteria bacterium]|nr:hypothetical protein [Candidatus Melainabacteria bacterium]